MEQFGNSQNRSMLCTVDRIEGYRAILKLEDGQSLDWPIDKLPGEVSEGSEVKIFLTTASSGEEERERTAKAVLNELLKTE